MFQNLRAGGADRGDLLGHVLPADLGGHHRHRGVGRRARLPSLRGPAGADRGAAVGDRPDHRLAPGDGGQAAAQLRLPGAAAAVALVVLLFVGGVDRHVFALLMFCAGTFVVAAVVQEFFRGIRARQAMTAGVAAGGAAAPGPPQPAALRRLHRARRRRAGADRGRGVDVVPALAHGDDQAGAERAWSTATGSSTCVRPRRPRRRRSRSGRCSPSAAAATGSTTLHTSYGLYPSQDPTPGPDRALLQRLRREPGRPQGRPDPGHLDGDQPQHRPAAGADQPGRRGAQQGAAAMPTPSRRRPSAQALSQLFQLRDIAIRGLTQRFVSHPWAATFLFIVSPLVTWLWLGAILAALGGLIALWPLPPPRRAPAPWPAPADPALRRPPPARAGTRLSPARWASDGVRDRAGRPGRRRVCDLGAAARRAAGAATGPQATPRIAELEAARDAKYREIRDAELDLRTGKLSTRTTRRSTRRCGPRRSRSCTPSTARRPRPGRPPTAGGQAD